MEFIPKRKFKQFELFGSNADFSSNSFSQEKNINHTSETILLWRSNIFNHQKLIIENFKDWDKQKSLFPNQNHGQKFTVNPFLLTSSPINFWRSNIAICNGPAMYFVIDSIKSSQIILYIGETNSADKRWRGDHDCKNYLNNYKESLSLNNIENQLDIRFFLDVPKEVKLRRKLEKELIYLWLPPFNKETRHRWSTTFTNN